MTCKPFIHNKIISCLIIGCGGCLTFAGANIYRGDQYFYSNIIMPTIHKLIDAEIAHNISIKMAKYGIVPNLNKYSSHDSLLRTTVWGLDFENPIGLAAGFDKDGQALYGLSKLGFGFIEIGSVTPKPQLGNDKPRVFRLTHDKAIINRYGFNSSGHHKVKLNICNPNNSFKKLILGVNLGKNKLSENSSDDYIDGMITFSDVPHVNYYVINISSPNTPNLRNLQNQKELNDLIEKVLKTKKDYSINKPLLIKISPDLSDTQLYDIAVIINKFSSNQLRTGIDGLIICNTTVSRPNTLKSSNIDETGGLSGLPLQQKSTDMIRKMYKLTNGNVPIIGVGGIFCGKDAYNKFKAGASLVQIYTAFTYEGPPIITKIKRELSSLLTSDGYSNISQVIGTDHR